MRNDFCSNYLEHSAKGTSWKDHAYISKKLVNGKWVYQYKLNSTTADGVDFLESQKQGDGSTNYRSTYAMSKREKKSRMAMREANASALAISRKNRLRGNQSDYATRSGRYYFDKDSGIGDINKNYREAEYQGRKAAYEGINRVTKKDEQYKAELQYKNDKPVAYYVDKFSAKGAELINNLIGRFKKKK